MFATQQVIEEDCMIHAKCSNALVVLSEVTPLRNTMRVICIAELAWK